MSSLPPEKDPNVRVVYLDPEPKSSSNHKLLIAAAVVVGALFMTFLIGKHDNGAHPAIVAPAAAATPIITHVVQKTPVQIQSKSTPIALWTPTITPQPNTPEEISAAINVACSTQNAAELESLIKLADYKGMTTAVADLRIKGWFGWLDKQKHPEVYAHGIATPTPVPTATPAPTPINPGDLVIWKYQKTGAIRSFERAQEEACWIVHINHEYWQELDLDNEMIFCKNVAYALASKYHEYVDTVEFQIIGSDRQVGIYDGASDHARITGM